MIEIKKIETTDTRTCDWSKVTKDSLLESSKQHISDVRKGLEFFKDKILYSAVYHDKTKIRNIDEFFEDFENGFDEEHQSWWEMHQETERHHLINEEYIQDDVNLIDILEMITDGVMAGLARSGSYRKAEISDELLRKAFDNTIELLLTNVKVSD